MIKIAIYGKGGIGKSTLCCNIAASLAAGGLKVMQIGCDPKADSTSLLMKGKNVETVLSLTRTKGQNVGLGDLVHESESGVLCVEAGGPLPGLGCAGRGIIAALETLKSKGAYEAYKPDVVIYDVLGDVVCGGFSMPMRGGYADKIFVVSSAEKMSRYAAGNICMAVENFKNRGYASLGGIILRKKGIENEEELVKTLADDFNTAVIAAIDNDEKVPMAEEKGMLLKDYAPDSPVAGQIDVAAESILKIFQRG